MNEGLTNAPSTPRSSSPRPGRQLVFLLRNSHLVLVTSGNMEAGPQVLSQGVSREEEEGTLGIRLSDFGQVHRTDGTGHEAATRLRRLPVCVET